MSRLRPLATQLPHVLASHLRSRRRALAGPVGVVALGIVAFSAVVGTGTTAHGAPAAVSTDPATVAAGAALYSEHCQSCHGVNGVGGVNGSPEIIDTGAAAADFYLTTGRMPLNNPHDQAIRHRPYFTAEQIRQLDAYVNALPAINHSSTVGPTIPQLSQLCPNPPGNAKDPGGSASAGPCVTLSDGQQLFQLNCAQCHQATGAGGMLSKGNIVPGIRNANELQTAEAVRIGPRPMPIFGTNQLSDQQVSALAHYVQYLHHPANRGGLGISGFGPVAEGFVGIILGFGILLVASRLIGNRG
ncbi:MAG: c-type cytochrome [Actinomycetota bacterium]|nr:c-type cytochrome [Actinomycetota bacterium]